MTRAGVGHSRGQILPIFALSLLVITLMASLVFDAAGAFVLRRELQGASDAAALAAANVIQSGTTRGCAIGGTPRADVVAAARASVASNLPSYPPSAVTVTCPNGYDNFAVAVRLGARSTGFFSAVAGYRGFDVSTSATAMNGPFPGAKWSVVELNPYHYPVWPSSGCPSVLFSGGPTVIFDGSMHVNSACPAGSGGALGTNGNSATLTFNNGSGAYLVGGYAPGPLVISPAPVTGDKVIADPLGGLPAMPSSIAPVATQCKGSTKEYSGSSSQVVLQGSKQSAIFHPGVYTGGIQLKSDAHAFFAPGIYILQGGGLDLGSQSQMFSVSSAWVSTCPSSLSTLTFTTATWPAACPTTSCGVLLYNAPSTSGTLGTVSVGAGASLMLNPYQPTYDETGLHVAEYQNLLLWQSGLPAQSLTYQQPAISLNGGGTIDIAGTVYTPDAQVFMTGGSGGSGGNAIDLTIQFISWDLQIQGNSSFHFYYQADSFAKPQAYGLIQ